MAIVIKKKGEYNNYDFSGVEPGDVIEFTLKYDSPREFEGKFGKFYTYAVNSHNPACDDAGFIAPKNLHLQLEKLSAGTRVKAVAKLKNMKGKFYVLWDASVVGESSTAQIPAPSQTSQLVDILVKNSQGAMKDLHWVRQELRAAGVTDEQIVQDISVEYAQRW